MGLTKTQRLSIAIGITSTFFVAELGVGFHTGSIALIADAFHVMNDLVSFIAALVAVNISMTENKRKDFSFGWQRAQLLSAFFNGVFLFALAISIFLQSIERFVSLQKVENPKLMLIMGCVGFGLNIISGIFLHEHDHDVAPPLPTEQNTSEGTELARPHNEHRHTKVHGHTEVHTETDDQAAQHNHSHNHGHSHSHDHSDGNGGHHEHDLAMSGVMLHVLSDAINNIGVIIAAVVIWKANYAGRFYADPSVSMGISLMILVSCLPLIKRSGIMLMGSVPSNVQLEDVKHDLEKIPGIQSVHELHIWRLNQQKTLASVHIVTSEKTLSSFAGIARIINECFHAYGIHSATLQPECAVPLLAQDNEDQSNLRRRVSNFSVSKCQNTCGSLCEPLMCCG